MGSDARVTDEVNFYRRRGDLKRTVRVVRAREPERLRWRSAVSTVTNLAGSLRGLERMRIEEPVREIILDLDDGILRRETVLDARKSGVDLDRGEILPTHNRWDLKRTAYLTGIDHELLGRCVRLPIDFSAPVDTAGVVLVSRSYATAYRQRADKLMQKVSADRDSRSLGVDQRLLLHRANRDKDLARRWAALSRSMLVGSR